MRLTGFRACEERAALQEPTSRPRESRRPEALRPSASARTRESRDRPEKASRRKSREHHAERMIPSDERDSNAEESGAAGEAFLVVVLVAEDVVDSA